jgi:hypothetical protein
MFGTSLDCASCSHSISIKSYMIWNSFLRLCSVNIVELGHRANQLLIPTSSSLCRIFVHGVLTREGCIYWNFISVVYFTLRRYFFPETYCMLCRSRRWLKVVLPARRKDEEKAARGRPAASALRWHWETGCDDGRRARRDGGLGLAVASAPPSAPWAPPYFLAALMCWWGLLLPPLSVSSPSLLLLISSSSREWRTRGCECTPGWSGSSARKIN